MSSHNALRDSPLQTQNSFMEPIKVVGILMHMYQIQIGGVLSNKGYLSSTQDDCLLWNFAVLHKVLLIQEMQPLLSGFATTGLLRHDPCQKLPVPAMLVLLPSAACFWSSWMRKDSNYKCETKIAFPSAPKSVPNKVPKQYFWSCYPLHEQF